MLPGFTEGQWWVQDAAAALPARLFGDVNGKTIVDLCAAPGGKTAQLAQAGARVTAVDRSPARMARLRDNLARLSLAGRDVVADAAEWPGGDGELRRRAGRCALHLDRHHPPPSRRRLAAAGSRHRRAGGVAEAPAAKGGRPAEAGRNAGLLHLFAGTGGRRAGDRRPARRRIRACAARRSRPARSRACAKSSPRMAICAPCPAICPTPTRGLAGWMDFTRRGWLNPDFTPEFRRPLR